MDRKTRVLLIGLDPAVVDFAKVPIPGLTAETLTAALESENARLRALGYEVRMLHIDTGETAEMATRQALTGASYDCVLIGAGLRLVPDHFLLFKKIVNIVHAHAPASSKICFNTRPTDSVQAVQRWI